MTSSAQAMWRVRRAHSFSQPPAAAVISGFHASSMATNVRPAHTPPGRSLPRARWAARRWATWRSMNSTSVRITGPASASGNPARSNSTSGASAVTVVAWSASQALGPSPT